MKRTARFCIVALLIPLILTGCASLDTAGRSTMLGSEAGGSIGALIGKRAGNTVVGATIGAALGASTGAFIGRRLDSIAENRLKAKSLSPLIVINGIPYRNKEAYTRLNRIASEEIVSIIVLKNEDAVRLYGNKGEHGAVLISISRQEI